MNILVIENQIKEYNDIIDFLCDALPQAIIYPSSRENDPLHEKKFEGFMNHVHVALDYRYEREYREQAKNFIVGVVNGVVDGVIDEKKKIDLMLMDHILGGAHHCHTGIDLATYLNSSRGSGKSLPVIPVVFISRTPRNDKRVLGDSDKTFPEALHKDVYFGYEQYEEKYKGYCKWIDKGYHGDKLLESKSYGEHLIRAIKDTYEFSVQQNRKDAVVKKDGNHATQSNGLKMVE